MKTINFTINSETGEYQFPEWGSSIPGTHSSSSLILKETKFNPDNSLAYQYAFSADEETFDRRAREAFEILLPDLFNRAVDCSGDDDYYDYLPDYVDMLTQANEAIGAFDPENFETFLNKLNEALHALKRGWATPEE